MSGLVVTLEPIRGAVCDFDDAVGDLREAMLIAAGRHGGPISQSLVAGLFPRITVEELGARRRLRFEPHEVDPRPEISIGACRLLLSAYRDTLEEALGSNAWVIVEPRENVADAHDALAALAGDEDPLVASTGPAPGFAASVAAALADAQLAPRVIAAEQIRRMARPPEPILRALIESCRAHREPSFVARAEIALVAIAESGRLDGVRAELLAAADPVLKTLGFALIPHALATKALPQCRAFGMIVDGLAHGPPADAAAARLINGVINARAPDQLHSAYDALRALIESGPEEDSLHEAVLAISNLFFNKAFAPGGFRAFLECLRDAPPPSDGFVRWALSVYARRPVASWREIAASGP